MGLHAELTRQGKRGPSGKKAVQDLQAYLRGGGVVMVSRAGVRVSSAAGLGRAGPGTPLLGRQ